MNAGTLNCRAPGMTECLPTSGHPVLNHADGSLGMEDNRNTTEVPRNGVPRNVIGRHFSFYVGHRSPTGIHPLGRMPIHLVICLVHQFDMPLTPRVTAVGLGAAPCSISTVSEAISNPKTLRVSVIGWPRHFAFPACVDWRTLGTYARDSHYPLIPRWCFRR